MNDSPEIIKLIILISFFAITFFTSPLRKKLHMLKGLGIWVIIFIAIIAFYGNRFEFKKYYDNFYYTLMPSSARVNLENNSISFYKSDNNHFMIDAEINSKTIIFLLDTGASSVSICYSDAIKIGINVNQLKFSIPVETASGLAYAAPVTLPKIKVGNIIVQNMQALVIKGSHTSLLGMSFLSRLKKFEVEQNMITLYQ